MTRISSGLWLASLWGIDLADAIYPFGDSSLYEVRRGTNQINRHLNLLQFRVSLLMHLLISNDLLAGKRGVLANSAYYRYFVLGKTCVSNWSIKKNQNCMFGHGRKLIDTLCRLYLKIELIHFLQGKPNNANFMFTCWQD